VPVDIGGLPADAAGGLLPIMPLLDLSQRRSTAAHGRTDTGIPIHGLEAALWAPGCDMIRGKVLEISPRDLKLEIAGSLKLGTAAEVVLTSAQFEFTTQLRGQVHWREPAGELQRIGIFLHRALLHEVVSHFWGDLRKELRYACEWPCLVSTRRGRRIHNGTLLNYSRTGVLVRCAYAPADGEEIALLDPVHPDALAIVTGTTRWRSPHETGQWLLGCELPDDHGVRLASYLRTTGCF
jgi:hypothetical protein